MDLSMKHTGTIIRELREIAGESQEQLAVAIEAPNRETIARWENGSRDLKREYIIAIARHFNVSTDYLLGLSDAPSVNLDIQNACKVTGLSEKAVQNLNDHEQNPSNSMEMIIISEIVSNKNFFKIAETLWSLECFTFTKEYLKATAPFLSELINRNDISKEQKEEYIYETSEYFGITSRIFFDNTMSKIKNRKYGNSMALPSDFKIRLAQDFFDDEAEQCCDSTEHRALKLYQQIISDYLNESGKKFKSRAIESSQIFAGTYYDKNTDKTFYDYIVNGLEEAINNAEDREKKE